MHHNTGRIPAAILAACLLALLVTTASAGFIGTLLGPGPGASQSFSIASLHGGGQWSSASLISQAASGSFASRTQSYLVNWKPPENQVYTTPTPRPAPSFMETDTYTGYSWDDLFSAPVICTCSGCS
jgi:hypothetical protein